jgi:hypothetical protein
VFIGDGMGLSTINAARIYKGQRQGNPGEETVLEYEKFPHAAFSKVKFYENFSFIIPLQIFRYFFFMANYVKHFKTYI